MINLISFLTIIVLGFTVSFVLNVKKRKKISPLKPWLTCIIDQLLSPLMNLRLGPFKYTNDIFTAVQIAKAQTGLSDLGGSDQGQSMIKRYQTCREIAFIKQGGKLKYSPIGYVASKELITKRVETRLKMVDYFKKHPNIQKIESNSIKSPIFIIGFPRTGTTFLHELLGLHPKVRMHYSWQQGQPVPKTHIEKTEDLKKDTELRYKSIPHQLRFKIFLSLAGDEIQYIHRIGYDEPEECTTPLALDLPWAILEIPLYIFSAKEVIEQGAGDAFVFYKQYLQLLSWSSSDISSSNITNGVRNDDGIRWMLKCPFHLPYLVELNEQFPDAILVWTHRDPVECIASACSLYEALMKAAFETNTIDRHALGKAVVEYSRLALDKAFESFKHLKSKIIHIRYADNIKSPKDICKQIVQKADLDFNQEYEKKIEQYLQKNKETRQKMKEKQDKKQMHEYNLEEYGLTLDQINTTFADYIKEYKLKE